MLPDLAEIDPVTSWSPIGCTADWATKADYNGWYRENISKIEVHTPILPNAFIAVSTSLSPFSTESEKYELIFITHCSITSINTQEFKIRFTSLQLVSSAMWQLYTVPGMRGYLCIIFPISTRKHMLSVLTCIKSASAHNICIPTRPVTDYIQMYSITDYNYFVISWLQITITITSFLNVINYNYNYIAM